MTAPKLLRPEDVADRLQISRRYAYDVIARLPERVRVGRCIRLPAGALEAFVDRGGDRDLPLHLRWSQRQR